MQLKDQFLLDPAITFLNFGSFGAVPKPILQAYNNWQLECEKDPVYFIKFRAATLLQESRTVLANYISCQAADVVYVTNPSYAVNIIAKSLQLQPGDEVLTTNLEYGACDKTWDYYCTKANAKYIKAPITLPVTDAATLVKELFAHCNANTKLIFISHITSVTGLILPVAAIAKKAKELGITVFVDGAHVPGHIPLNISNSNFDIYTGACHKWMMTPRGSSFLYVKKELQHLFDPLTISWGYQAVAPGESIFIDNHQMQGTRDITPFLCIQDSIAFMKKNNWEAIKLHCKHMVKQYAPIFAKALNATLLSPITDEWLGQMLSVPITCNNAMELELLLKQKYNITVPIMQQNGKSYVRYSINAFNTEEDLDKLLAALKALGIKN